VTLMIHTFVGRDREQVRATVWQPFRRYLASSADLLANLGRSLGLDLRSRSLSAEEMDALLDHAAGRYFADAALFGAPEDCLGMARRCREAGVDELACLVDFGVAAEEALAALTGLAEVRERSLVQAWRTAPVLPPRGEAPRPTHLQCTPSLATMLTASAEGREALGSLASLLVGGEALPAFLARQLCEQVPGRVTNVYGPTETAIWSASHRLRGGSLPPIGRPLANTEIYLLDRRLEPVPMGAPGELFIGGQGVARGYHQRADLTAERFLPDAFAGLRGDGPRSRRGARIYRTGDLARALPDGSLEFLGRLDQQVKIRGHRIEPGEVEAVLAAHPAVREAVVVARADESGDRRLLAYVVPSAAPARLLEPRLTPDARERALAGRQTHRWPNGMLVAHLGAFQASLAYREIFHDQTYLRHGIEVHDGACVFDVGANIGTFTLFASTRAQRLKVYAFEPIPPSFSVLAANLEIYGIDAELFNVGLSARRETADFTFYPEMSGLSGRYSDEETDRRVTRAVVRSGLAEVEGVSEVDLDEWLQAQFASEVHHCTLRTLSDIIAERGVEVIDLLKIDVERAELDVLAGIAEQDWPKIRQVVLEVDGRQRLAAVVALLERQGFAVVADDFVVVEAAGGEDVSVFMVYARRDGLHEGKAALQADAGEIVAALRAHTRERLPDFMVPSAFVVLDELPLTPNGKLDRRALPDPGGRDVRVRESYLAPGSATEQAVAQVWRELLGVDQVGMNDNFFELGGNSLLVVQVRNRLKEKLGLDISLVDLFRHPTVGRLSAAVDPLAGSSSTALVAARSRAALQKKARGQRRSEGRSFRETSTGTPVVDGQERLPDRPG
jgi:FkbM family methyltransferase